jgi:hypothetical protein
MLKSIYIHGENRLEAVNRESCLAQLWWGVIWYISSFSCRLICHGPVQYSANFLDWPGLSLGVHSYTGWVGW